MTRVSLTIRETRPGDAETAAEWSRRHGRTLWTAALPPLGCVCEDAEGPCGMAWVYCACNIGVAFVEHLVMRPGLSLRQSRETGLALMEGLGAAVRGLDYRVLVAYALPACARFLRSAGWEETDERLKVSMVKALT